jgi:prepilin-type N-terminal cleavage/methylation domain-containing protein/prepilin-type processing-associated H-X9-DG protein
MPDSPSTAFPGAATKRSGFTLTELMVVVGLIAILMSLLFPVVAKVRVAASAAKCSSNLRQMGVAWSIYVAESKGRAPEYIWNTPETPDLAWHSYWPGILEQHGVRDGALICPAASEPIRELARFGYGDAIHNWTGKYTSNGTVIRFSDALYRDGSYGYNRYLTVGNFAGNAACITALQEACHTPLFMDCVYVDTMPLNGSQAAPAAPPPDLTGSHDTAGSPEHWKFLIARHGRGINVCMADSSVSWVPLEDTYTLSWKNGWAKYHLTLPGT